MRRRPNPWVVVPALSLGLLAAGIAWWITDATCRYNQVGAGCPGWTVVLTVASFLGVTLGVGLLMVLVYRSLSEWRERSG